MPNELSKIVSMEDRDIPYLTLILKTSDVSCYISIDKKNYWQYVSSNVNVFYFKGYDNNCLLAAIHCEILNKTLYIDIMVIPRDNVKKGGAFLLVAFIIGLIVFIISFLLSVFVLLGMIFKNIGVTSFGLVPVIFFLLFPCFCFVMECGTYHYASHVWGFSYMFIVMNSCFIVMQYFSLVGSAVFTKNSIYRLTKFLVWKRHTYDEVIGYVMKNTSGRVVRRFGQYHVVTFDVEIYFTNNQYASFSTKDQFNKKVVHIKQLLEEHHCHRNGRIKHKSRLHK